MQFKVAAILSTAFFASGAFGAAAENQPRQFDGTFNFTQPCGSLNLTVLSFSTPLTLPCLENLTCNNTLTQTVPIPAPLSEFMGLEIDLGVSIMYYDCSGVSY